MWEIFGAGLAFIFPVVLHFSALWGEVLLEKIVTPFPKLDAVYNEHPLLLSLISGMFLAAASLARTHATAFYILATVGLLLLILDVAASLISFVRHIKKKRRG
jgi:hypothetical protein